MTPFLGQLMLVSFDFAPRGWTQCNGQLLPINQNQGLFSLLGTTFGGDGRVNFALPDLRGRTHISFGQCPGLQSYFLGQVAGEENHTVTLNEMPAHTHPFRTTQTPASSGVAVAGAVLANTSATMVMNIYTSNEDPAAQLNSASISSVGQSQPHTNQSPYLVLNWVIALQGIFPSQT